MLIPILGEPLGVLTVYTGIQTGGGQKGFSLTTLGGGGLDFFNHTFEVQCVAYRCSLWTKMLTKPKQVSYVFFFDSTDLNYIVKFVYIFLLFKVKIQLHIGTCS